MARLYERPSVPVLSLVLLGIAGATWSAGGGGSRVAVPVLATGGLVLTLLGLRAVRDPKARVDLSLIVPIALLLRLAVFIVVRQTVGPYVFGPDAWAYEIVGSEIVQSWEGLRALPSKVVGTLQIGHYYLNAVLQWLFGPSPAAPAVLNVFLGAWTTVPVYFLASSVVRGNRGVARWAALLVACFPSLVLWSVLNLRDAPTVLLLMTALAAFVSAQEGPRARTLLVGTVCLACLLLFREYLALLLTISVPVGFLMTRGKNPQGSLALGLLLLTVVVSSFAIGGVGTTLVTEPTLGTLEALRKGLAEGAASAYGGEHDVSTVGGAIRFLPVGLAYFLLAPFPWQFGSALQAVTLPEILIWYALTPFVLRGLYLGLKHDSSAYMVLLAALVTISIAYALVQGNVGTAFRHRAHVLPVLFVFAAVGLRDLQGMLIESRRRAMTRRAAASSHLGLDGVPWPPARAPGGGSP